MGRWDKFNSIVYKVLKLAYINLLWILFTIVGLIVFGFFPATAAMYTITRRWVYGEKNIKIFKTFWEAYRSDFFKVNGLGLIFLVISYFLYFDFNFLMLNSGKLTFLFPILIFIFIATVVTLLFFFPVFSHFKLNFFQYIKQSFLIAVVSPLEILLILLSAIGMYYIILFLPGIIPIFSGSVFAYLSTLISFRAFRKIEKRKKHL